MAEVLASLKKIGGNGEQYTETSLWTNSAPTSNFAGQTVTLSDNISKYKYIAIKWKDSTSVDQVGEIILDSVNFITQSPAPNYYNFPAMVSSSQSYARAIVYISANQIQFGTCYKINANASNNAYDIPTEILGINELAHQTVIGKYDILPFQNLGGSTIPSFTTKGKAKAIWMMYVTASGNRGLTITNVNPYTGEIDNNATYAIDSNNIGGYVTREQNFVVTDNSVSLDATLSSNALKVALAYTYE